MTFKHEPRRPSAYWVVVADRARARILEGNWPDFSELNQLEVLAHPEGAAHQRDVESDTQGRFYEGRGPKHKADAGLDFKHKTALEFARQIVDRLEQGKSENRFGQLVLIAPALFLSMLREALPEPLRRMVVADLDKDLIAAAEPSIVGALQKAVSKTVGI